MKLKYLILVILIAIDIATVIASESKSQQIPPQTLINNSEAQSELELTKHIEDIAQKQFNSTENLNSNQILSQEKLRELEGHINKEFGIREDILRFIEKEIPAENERAKHAAIKYAQQMNFVYYHANPKEALETMPKEFLALRCLSLFFHESYLNFTENIHSLMINTKEREEHIWDISKRYFGWKILKGHGLSTTQENEICNSEKY